MDDCNLIELANDDFLQAFDSAAESEILLTECWIFDKQLILKEIVMVFVINFHIICITSLRQNLYTNNFMIIFTTCIF